jgi:hypothetical protein
MTDRLLSVKDTDMYIIHLEWNHFVSHLLSDVVVWIQDYVHVRHDRYGQAMYQHRILASCKGKDDLLHVVHLLVVDSVDANDLRPDRARAMAVKIVKEEIARMCCYECGLLLVAGLSEDLDRYVTTQGLWRWQGGDLIATRRDA